MIPVSDLCNGKEKWVVQIDLSSYYWHWHFENYTNTLPKIFWILCIQIQCFWGKVKKKKEKILHVSIGGNCFSLSNLLFLILLLRNLISTQFKIKFILLIFLYSFIPTRTAKTNWHAPPFISWYKKEIEKIHCMISLMCRKK